MAKKQKKSVAPKRILKREAAKKRNPWKIDVYEDIDLSLQGYEVAKGLDAKCREMGIKYLHLTPIDNAHLIREEGLMSEEGNIFFCDTALVLAHIAINQVFCDHFQVFGLAPDADLPLVQDEVGEMISQHQWIYECEHVEPELLVDLGEYRAAPPLDQFVPYPPGTIEQLRTMQGIEEEERAKHLARMERGMWPHHVLAYLERAVKSPEGSPR